MLNLDGKVILVALRRIEESGTETRDAFFGKVVRFNTNTVVLEREDGTEYSMPYDEDVIEVAEPGFYELENGTTCEDPEYIANWVVYATAIAQEKHGHRNHAGG